MTSHHMFSYVNCNGPRIEYDGKSSVSSISGQIAFHDPLYTQNTPRPVILNLSSITDKLLLKQRVNVQVPESLKRVTIDTVSAPAGPPTPRLSANGGVW